MKKITLLAAVALFAFGCSKDDDSKKVENCNCFALTLIYNEQMQAFEPTSTQPYSNDCDDATPRHDNGDGTYSQIQCHVTED